MTGYLQASRTDWPPGGLVDALGGPGRRMTALALAAERGDAGGVAVRWARWVCTLFHSFASFKSLN